jgi:hypothetical protein
VRQQKQRRQAEGNGTMLPMKKGAKIESGGAFPEITPLSQWSFTYLLQAIVRQKFSEVAYSTS